MFYEKQFSICSFFGKAFEQAANSTNSRTLHDNFDTFSKYTLSVFGLCEQFVRFWPVNQVYGPEFDLQFQHILMQIRSRKHFHNSYSSSADSSRTVVSYRQMYVH